MSERADFARACKDHGIIFIGPTPEQLDMFDDKMAGEPLLWIEAMKMETAVCSPRDATVKNVLIESRSNVTAQDRLVVLAAE